MNDQADLPVSTHRNVLKIGDHELVCHVLSDGRRVFEMDSLRAFFGAEMFDAIVAQLDIAPTQWRNEPGS